MWSATRRSDNQLNRQRWRSLDLLAIDHPHQEASGSLSESIGGLTHDGKRWVEQRRPVVIIETDEGDIFRASQPTFPEGVERAEGQLVGSHENS